MRPAPMHGSSEVMVDITLPAQAPMRNDKSSFPKSSYPSDWKTLNQVDYPSDRGDSGGAGGAAAAARAQRPPRDSGPLLPKDVEPSFDTAYHSHYCSKPPMRTDAAASKAAGGNGANGFGGTAATAAGRPAPLRAPYNIISGGAGLTSNRFEHFDASMDNRRTRRPL